MEQVPRKVFVSRRLTNSSIKLVLCLIYFEFEITLIAIQTQQHKIIYYTQSD